MFVTELLILGIIFSVLIIDQIIKIWIKTHMYWHESIRVTDWLSGNYQPIWNTGNKSVCSDYFIRIRRNIAR